MIAVDQHPVFHLCTKAGRSVSGCIESKEEFILESVFCVEISIHPVPLSDAAAYQGTLKQLQDSIKAMARPDGGAVTGATGWTVNGSEAQGRKLVKENSKLMLRAYNAEADNLVRGLKPYKLDSAVARLVRAGESVGVVLEISAE